MPRDESMVMADIQSALQQLGHVEFEAAVRREALLSDLRRLDAELGRVKLAAALAAASATKEEA